MTDKQSEFIEQLFNAISSDPVMSAELKISLLRLQLPIHKLSISDISFFSNPKHPARRILFIVKNLARLSANDSTTIKKIDIILSELFSSNPNANKFSIVNQNLEKLTTICKKRNSDDSNANKPQIKSQLSHKIKHCLQGYDIPAPCQDLILKLWPNTLFFILKNHGDNSSQWTSAINLYSELLESIQNIKSFDQHNKLKNGFMKVVRNNNNMLLLYHQSDKVEPAIKSLIGHYNHILGNSHFSNSAGNHIESSHMDDISSLPASVKPGIWCEIYISNNTPPRRLRLSLINSQTGKLIFVNRKGIKMLEKHAAEFTQELKNGLSKIYKHDALFTRPSERTRFQKIG